MKNKIFFISFLTIFLSLVSAIIFIVYKIEDVIRVAGLGGALLIAAAITAILLLLLVSAICAV